MGEAEFETWWATANTRLTDLPKAQAKFIWDAARDKQAVQPVESECECRNESQECTEASNCRVLNLINQPAQPAGAQSWEPDEEACKFLADMITADPDQITRVGFHLGYAKDDDGNLVHGFSVYEAEYPEEGVHTLVETKPEPAAAINEQLLEALKLADATLEGAHMNADVVYKKIKAAIAAAEKAKGGGL